MTDRGWSPVAEDYVRLIWKAEERGLADISTGDLATALGVRKTTVSTTLRRLHEQGLVVHEPYGRLELTETGRQLAVGVVRRHRLLETFLHDRLGYSWDEVDGEAHRLEHVVSERFVERIDDLLGRPTHDPHGDPIPDRHGVVHDVGGTPLSAAPVGHVGFVVRVHDDRADVLQWLAEHDIGLGMAVRVAGSRFDGAMTSVVVDGLRRVEVPVQVAQALFVENSA